MMFLHELEPIEAEAFLTLASEMIEEDDVITAEEDEKLQACKEALNLPTFTYDPAACAAARFTMSQLNDTSKRKVYMELYSFAVCDGMENPSERRALNELREALGLSERLCRMLENAVLDLYSVYTGIEHVLEIPDETPVTMVID